MEVFTSEARDRRVAIRPWVMGNGEHNLDHDCGDDHDYDHDHVHVHTTLWLLLLWYCSLDMT